MEKTIDCENCSREYTFEENPKFPRKYCDVCSAKKKAEFAGKNGDDKPEVIKFTKEIVTKDIKDKGYHLTPENINLGALHETQVWFGDRDVTRENFWFKVIEFKKFIETGQW